MPLIPGDMILSIITTINIFVRIASAIDKVLKQLDIFAVFNLSISHWTFVLIC